MKTRLVYQTLKDRDNPDDVERLGPFLCLRNDAWLGEGYYFWESFINNAHWWGHTNHPEGYIICEATYVDEENKCLDLNKPEGIQEILGAISLMEKNGIKVSNSNIYIPRVIEFLKKIGHFRWEAAKVSVTNTKDKNSSYNSIAIFNDRYPHAYIDLCPAIQICFYSKTALQLSGYKIIFPNEYVEGYAV